MIINIKRSIRRLKRLKLEANRIQNGFQTKIQKVGTNPIKNWPKMKPNIYLTQNLFGPPWTSHSIYEQLIEIGHGSWHSA